MVDFLHTAVACFRDLPRGHIINLAQHLQQVLTSSFFDLHASRTSMHMRLMPAILHSACHPYACCPVISHGAVLLHAPPGLPAACCRLWLSHLEVQSRHFLDRHCQTYFPVTLCNISLAEEYIVLPAVSRRRQNIAPSAELSVELAEASADSLQLGQRLLCLHRWSTLTELSLTPVTTTCTLSRLGMCRCVLWTSCWLAGSHRESASSRLLLQHLTWLQQDLYPRSVW